MLRPAVEGFYLFWVGWFLAQLEIQIEGSHGWAETLPCWRLQQPWILRLTNGKPVTGYHFYMAALLISLFHLPLCFVPFSRVVEAKILSLYFIINIAWDFQWFVWNPAWGVRRFFTDRIWWFPRKVLGFPAEYYAGIVSSLLSMTLLWPAGL